MTDAERIDRLESVVEALLRILNWRALPFKDRADMLDMLHQEPQQASGDGGSAE